MSHPLVFSYQSPILIPTQQLLALGCSKKELSQALGQYHLGNKHPTLRDIERHPELKELEELITLKDVEAWMRQRSKVNALKVWGIIRYAFIYYGGN